MDEPPFEARDVPASCGDGPGVCVPEISEEEQLELFPELSEEERKPRDLGVLRNGSLAARFVAEYFLENDAKKAYLKAGYNCSDESARRSGSRLLSRVDVQAALAHLDKQVSESAIVSKLALIGNILETRAKAEKAGGVANLRTVMECNRLLAQIKGMLRDKLEVSGDAAGSLAELRLLVSAKKEDSGNEENLQEQI